MNTRRTPCLEDLAPEPRAALLRFRDANGRTWKYKLMVHWMNGTDEKLEDAGFMRQIRNTHGPVWLGKLKDD